MGVLDLVMRSERLDPTEPTRGMLEVRWNRQRKDPTWVVGEQRQFLHLWPLTDLLSPSPSHPTAAVAASSPLGDSNRGECFRISFKLIPGIKNLLAFFLCWGLWMWTPLSVSMFLLLEREQCKEKHRRVHFHYIHEGTVIWPDLGVKGCMQLNLIIGLQVSVPIAIWSNDIWSIIHHVAQSQMVSWAGFAYGHSLRRKIFEGYQLGKSWLSNTTQKIS